MPDMTADDHPVVEGMELWWAWGLDHIDRGFARKSDAGNWNLVDKGGYAVGMYCRAEDLYTTELGALRRWQKNLLRKAAEVGERIIKEEVAIGQAMNIAKAVDNDLLFQMEEELKKP